MITRSGIRFSTLTKPWQQLIRTFQRVNYGRVEQVPIVNGQPVLVPAPTIVWEFKCRGEWGPRPELDLDDFQVGVEIIELIKAVRTIDKGVIRFIEVRDGLPCRMAIAT